MALVLGEGLQKHVGEVQKRATQAGKIQDQGIRVRKVMDGRGLLVEPWKGKRKLATLIR